MKRSRAPSSRVVSVPKSTHYVNWIRLFFALPSTLTSSPGNNSAVLQQALQPHKTSEGQVLLTTSAEKFIQLHEKNQSVLFCTLYICVILCVCVCVILCVCVCVQQQGQELREWQRVCGGQKLEPSDLVLRVSCLPAVTVPLASYSASRPPARSLWRRLPRKLKAVFKERQERRDERRHRAKKECVKRGWWRGFRLKRVRDGEVNISSPHRFIILSVGVMLSRHPWLLLWNLYT